jgi:hypothetical protein
MANKAKQSFVPSDKRYRLKSRKIPLSFTIASRNTKRFPLLWYDEENNVNRPLRYARNQKSPFEDEQDGNAIVEPIVFENGFLAVPKNNPALQAFLYYHPQNGTLFEEIDSERDAQKELDKVMTEMDAMIRAKELSIDQLESLGRVLFNKDTTKVTTAELKRDIYIYAKQNPSSFLSVLEDPMLSLQSEVHLFFDKGLLTFKNNSKEVWYNTPSNKKKMLNVPFGEDSHTIVSMFLKSDDGIESLKMLKHHLEKI